MTGKIEYGFGKEYLSNWSINEALREVFQNYIDYGEYNITIEPILDDSNKIRVIISNDYQPEKLEFLRIGNSDKGNNENAIGHHGEGLKMAFLIFLRENLHFQIWTPKWVLNPCWSLDSIIGDTLRIEYSTNCSTIYDSKYSNKFVTEFICDKESYEDFVNNLINEDDVIHTCYYGDIVSKTKGNLYSGGIFVCKLPDLSKAYNVKPSYLSLDRDRRVPSNWDVEYYCSRINESYTRYVDSNKEEEEPVEHDFNSKDYRYLNNVTDSIANEFKSTTVGKNIEFIHKSTKEVLRNSNVRDALLKHPKFAKAKKIGRRTIYIAKETVAKRKSVMTLLKDFKKNYCRSAEMQDDINIIIKRLNNK